MIPLTTEVSVRFYVHDAVSATLTVRNENATFLTIIHESAADTIAHEIVGAGCTSPIQVSDAETLTFIARANGHIQSTQICEVDIDSADFGFILSPRGGFNLIVHQDNVGSLDDLHKIEDEIPTVQGLAVMTGLPVEVSA